MNKPILCLDFDGVIHSYTSGWIEADFIPDPPVPGAFEFIHVALDHFDVVIYSSRSNQKGGINAMFTWMKYWAVRVPGWAREDANKIINHFQNRAWPESKPSAFLTIDDRAITFNGKWPKLSELQSFKPWNRK